MARTASKRALAASQSSQSLSQGSQPRPTKRPRVRGPSTSLPETTTTTTAATIAPQVDTAANRARTTAGKEQSAGGTTAPARPQLPPPRKRTVHPGSLRRLSTGHPAHALALATDSSARTSERTREKATLSGAKIGGKSKDLKDRVQAEELWIRRPKRKGARTTGKQGLGYAGYLKMGVAAFVQRGCTTLTLHALGAAIPLCLSLALAIRDAIPGGEPTSVLSVPRADSEGDEPPLVRLVVRTGSKEVHDEITPDDEDDDIVYQTRTKSTVSVTLSLSDPLRSCLGAAPAKDAGRFGRSGTLGTANRRGRKRGGLNAKTGGGPGGGGGAGKGKA